MSTENYGIAEKGRKSLEQEHQWTRSLPTKPGWYWYRNDLIQRKVIIEVNESLEYQGEELKTRFGENRGWFHGPITPPPLPEGKEI
ncbi:MAG TPA: hypothetical protein VF077_12945 [Nitrospiraceae bacterium]